MRKGKAAFWLFLSPSLAGLSAFYLIPFLGGFYFAMSSDGYPRAFVGLSGFQRTLGDGAFLLGLRNTFALASLCAPLALISAFLLAICFWRQGARAPRVGILLPYVLPSVAVVAVFSVFFGARGWVNELLATLGASRMAFLGGSAMRVPIVIMYLWRNTGFFATLLFSALQTAPEELYQLAALDGAGFFAVTRHVTLPHILPTALFTALLSVSTSLKVFKESYLLGGNYPDQSVYTLQHYINNHFASFNYSALTSASYLFAALIFCAFLLLFALEARSRRDVA